MNENPELYPNYRQPKGKAPPENIKINPERKEHYQLVFKMKDAPVKFEKAYARELYQATDCWYVTDRWVGATRNPMYVKELDLIKVDDNTYVTDFYTDTPLNEDYYGEGMCHWQFLTAGIFLKPTGKDRRETTLRAEIEPNDLEKFTENIPELVIKREFQKKNFPIRDFIEEGEDGIGDSGISEKSAVVLKQRLKPEDIFSIEMTLRKVEK